MDKKKIKYEKPKQFCDHKQQTIILSSKLLARALR